MHAIYSNSLLAIPGQIGPKPESNITYKHSCDEMHEQNKDFFAAKGFCTTQSSYVL